jgi:CDP-glucose 4,6-dehydratase
MNPEFWRGKRVFITGHTGFKGAWLSYWLVLLGAKVTGYALSPPTEKNCYDFFRLDKILTSVLGDVRDAEFLTRSLQRAQPEIVFHLAAQPIVRRSYTDPVMTYSTNVMGTVNLMESVRNTPSVRAVVNVTTDKCYENREWDWGYRETESLGGFDPYSSSKACSELVTSAYRRSFFNSTLSKSREVNVATARAGNVIGGGDWAEDRLIPDVLLAFEMNTPARIRNPNSIRPWQHVLEPLSGYLQLGEKLCSGSGAEKFSDAWNFGPVQEDEWPVSEVVDQLAQKWENGASWVIEGGAHPHEATYLKLDISRAVNKLGWRPRLRLEEAISMTVDWHRGLLSGADPREITNQQICSYQMRRSAGRA